MRKHIWKILLIPVVILAAGAVMLSTYFSRINTVEISKNDEELGIKEQIIPVASPSGKEEDKAPAKEDKEESKIINIALFGGDKRQKNDVSHTDATMVLSIDTVHKKIKLSSIMRDAYVDIYNHGKTKFTHAYVYGGPELTIRTINENFNLDVRDYVYVDFFGLEKLIDTLGGVEMDVKKAEIPLINKCIKEVADIKKTKPHLLSKTGVQKLNGEQAVAYSRIRYTGNGDFERTERQRKVLTALLDKIKEAGPLKFPSIVSNVLPYVETSLSVTDILKLGTYAFTSGINTIEQSRFPMDNYCKGQIIDKVWYLVADMDATRRQIHEFIYEDTASEPAGEKQQASVQSGSKF